MRLQNNTQKFKFASVDAIKLLIHMLSVVVELSTVDANTSASDLLFGFKTRTCSCRSSFTLFDFSVKFHTTKLIQKLLAPRKPVEASADSGDADEVLEV